MMETQFTVLYPRADLGFSQWGGGGGGFKKKFPPICQPFFRSIKLILRALPKR